MAKQKAEEDLVIKDQNWLLSPGLQLDRLIEETHQMIQQERIRQGLKPVKFGSRKTLARKRKAPAPSNP